MKTLGVRIGFVATMATTGLSLALAGGCGDDKGDTGGAGGTTSAVTSTVTSTVASVTHASSTVQSGTTTNSATTTNNSAASTNNSASSTADSGSVSAVSASASTSVSNSVSAVQASVSTAIAATSTGSAMNSAPCHNECANDAGCQATPINPGSTCATCVQNQVDMGTSSSCALAASQNMACTSQPDCTALVICVVTTMNQASCEAQHPTGFAILQPLVFASCGDCG